jgi:GNAT superfamily N-acetyltransferase
MVARRDYHDLIRVRAEWLDHFCGNHPASERWCPAVCRVPNIEDEHGMFDYLRHVDGRWAAVLAGEAGLGAYILCRTDKEGGKVVIEHGSPRVSPACAYKDAAGELVQFVCGLAEEWGLQTVEVGFHGFPDEVGPLADLCLKQGFEDHSRLEMVSRQLPMSPGSPPLQFRSAADVGLETACEVEATLMDWSLEHTRGNLEFSRKMWSVDDNDWLVAYDGESPAGTVRMALTPEGIGVLDAFGLLAGSRGRGLGIHLLAAGLSLLIGRTSAVWLDVDRHNVPALKTYEKAHFQVHHRHGGMKKQL